MPAPASTACGTDCDLADLNVDVYQFPGTGTYMDDKVYAVKVLETLYGLTQNKMVDESTIKFKIIDCEAKVLQWDGAMW